MSQELRRVVSGDSFDEQAMPDLDSEDLDFRAASESTPRSVPAAPPDRHAFQP